MIQIGMRCGPDWLCDSIEWLFGMVVLLLVIGLIVSIIRQYRADTAKRKGKKKHR